MFNFWANFWKTNAINFEICIKYQKFEISQNCQKIPNSLKNAKKLKIS